MFRKLRDTFRPDTCYKQFFIFLFMVGLSYGLYKGTIDNYLAEIVGMGEFDRGVSEFFRELPGLALIFILAIFYKFSAEKMYKMGLIVMLIGMVMQSVIPPHKVLVILATFHSRPTRFHCHLFKTSRSKSALYEHCTAITLLLHARHIAAFN